MAAVLFLIYIAIGGGAGWALFMAMEQSIIVSSIGGVVTTLVLGQIHLLVGRPKQKIEDIDFQLEKLGDAQRGVESRLKVSEARTDAIETTVKHELTERRDALVSEMRQLEGLIDRLSHSFENQLDTKQTSPLPPQDDAALRAVKDALQAGRVDLHLQPIVSLPQRRVMFYEGFSRLRDATGSLILPSEFLDAAQRSNLMGLIDNMTLFRCVQIVRRLAERDRRVGVFCNLSAASLIDGPGFDQFLSYVQEHQDLSNALIFELHADVFELRSRQMRENMDKLTALGFRFSIDHAPDLALDLPRLQDAGVRFVKMNGGQMLAEMKDPNGSRPISAIQRKLSGEDISAIFSRYGITLIAEKIEAEATVVEILGYDVPYGQGHVFGAPRPIKASLMEETAPPAEFMQKFQRFG